MMGRILFFLATLLAMAIPAHADTSLHYTVQNTPVLVVLEPKGAGSGIYIKTEKGVYLVTAKHVLLNSAGKLKSPKITLISYSGNEQKKRTELVVDLDVAIREASMITHNSKDIVAVRTISFVRNSRSGAAEPRLAAGVTEKGDPGANVTYAGANDTLRYKDVKVSNDVFLLGYPISLGLDAEGLIDLTAPLLRKGIVAGKNEKNHTVIIDCPAYPGNSGGPVFEIDSDGRGTTLTKLIGIVTNFVPLVEKWKSSLFDYENVNLSNSGYAVVVPLDDILDFLEKY